MCSTNNRHTFGCSSNITQGMAFPVVRSEVKAKNVRVGKVVERETTYIQAHVSPTLLLFPSLLHLDLFKCYFLQEAFSGHPI